MPLCQVTTTSQFLDILDFFCSVKSELVLLRVYIYIIYVWYMYIFTLNKEQREQSQIKSEA